MLKNKEVSTLGRFRGVYMQPEELLNEGNNEGRKAAAESPLLSLEKDLKFFQDSIREVATEIRVEGLSEYQHELALGELILDRHDLASTWSIHASTLEEFLERGVIKKELKQRFEDTYKDPNKFICVFVVTPEGANFVFVPYGKG
jgi:hypothetical protein